MRIRHLIAAALFIVAALLAMRFSSQASAFTLDEKSNINSDGSPRYVDPDEQLAPFLLQGQTRNDHNGGNFGPPYASRASDGRSQWFTFPEWLFSTAPPRK